MKIRRSFAIVLRYLLLLKAYPVRIFQIFVWGILEIVLWGFISKYLDSASAAAFSFGPVLLGAVVFEAIMVRAQQGVSTPFLEDVWARNLLNFFASPLTIFEYVTGLALIGLITSVLGIVVLFAAAILFFGLSFAPLGLSVAAYLLALFLFGVSLGIVGVAIVLRFGPSAEWFIWPIPAILSPFSAVFYPVATLPAWMQSISHVLPTSYVFESMRAALTHGEMHSQMLMAAVGLDLVYLVIAYVIFQAVYRSAVRNGAIARYSAESFQ